MVPLPLRSSTRKASSEPTAVHAICSAVPSASRSKFTPPAAFVRLNPLPETSIRIGLPKQVGHGIIGSPPPPSPVQLGGYWRLYEPVAPLAPPLPPCPGVPPPPSGPFVPRVPVDGLKPEQFVVPGVP